jgi:hypothetical protein
MKPEQQSDIQNEIRETRTLETSSAVTDVDVDIDVDTHVDQEATTIRAAALPPHLDEARNNPS